MLSHPRDEEVDAHLEPSVSQFVPLVPIGERGEEQGLLAWHIRYFFRTYFFAWMLKPTSLMFQKKCHKVKVFFDLIIFYSSCLTIAVILIISITICGSFDQTTGGRKSTILKPCDEGTHLGMIVIHMQSLQKIILTDF